MLSASWWGKADIDSKERAIKVLNKEALSLGAVKLQGLREFARYKKGWLTGDARHAFIGKMRRDWQPVQDKHDQLAEVLKWRDGAARPRDIRRCKYKTCSRFFLVRKSRADRLYCSPKCGRNYRASKSMNTKVKKIRERKLKRVRSAWKAFRGYPGRKQRTAQRAKVTENFVSYAIRAGELKP